MSFAHPWVLLLLVAPLTLLVWLWRGERASLAAPVDHATAQSRRWVGFGVILFESLGALLLAVVITLLAGPQTFGAPQSQRVMSNIQFAVDVSGSMSSKLGDGTCYDVSMSAIDEFLTFREGDSFGLTFFGHNFLHWVPLTQDPSAIRCATPFMRPEVAPPWFGGTAIGNALRGCQEVLTSRPDGNRMIIIVTDGMSGDIEGGADVQLAQELKTDGIVVYAIHVGGGDPPGAMVNISHLTGGDAFPAGDKEGMKQIFARIDKMQQTKMERTLAEPQDNFAPYCYAGLALLGLATVGSFGARFTPW
jgi:Ca-activated chloride channel family protein